MKVYTERGQIATVAERFRKQYPKSRDLIHSQLMRLDPIKATADDVAQIIGNKSWTDLSCDECGCSGCKTVVEVGEEPDYESATACLCVDCLMSVVREMITRNERS